MTVIKLSEREKQIVAEIAKGSKYLEIATVLGLSFETVKTYAARVRKKLGLRSKVHVAIWALQNTEQSDGRNESHKEQVGLGNLQARDENKSAVRRGRRVMGQRPA